MSYSDLLDYNPWWKKESAIKNDPQIQKWEESELKWNPRLRATFVPKDLIYSLRGPRQVGKTTLIKLEIRDLLENDYPKWNIMYYSLEIENSPKDVINIINEYLDKTKKLRKAKRCFIFLDEISNVNNWQQGIKKLVDMGKLKNCTVVATGSHSIDLKHATERLPGRRGKSSGEVLDKIMPTMKFSEYVYSVDKEMKKVIDANLLRSWTLRFRIINSLLKNKIPKPISELWASYQKELNSKLSDYMITGGIPSAIDEYIKNGTIDIGTYDIYIQAIIGDLNRARKDESYMNQIMPNVIKNIGNPVGWKNLQENSDIGSHHTVEEYVKTLSDMFTLSFFYRYNAADKRPKFDSYKKVYFHDVFFLHAIQGRIKQKDPFKLSLGFLKDPVTQSRIMENILSDHMIRLAFNRSSSKMTFDYHQSVFYWRGQNDREVDFLIKDDNSLIPIELKYQNTINKEDYYGLIDFKKVSGAKESLLITKDDLSVETEATNIPASLFLLLI